MVGRKDGPVGDIPDVKAITTVDEESEITPRELAWSITGLAERRQIGAVCTPYTDNRPPAIGVRRVVAPAPILYHQSPRIGSRAVADRSQSYTRWTEDKTAGGLIRHGSHDPLLVGLHPPPGTWSRIVVLGRKRQWWGAQNRHPKHPTPDDHRSGVHCCSRSSPSGSHEECDRNVLPHSKFQCPGLWAEMFLLRNFHSALRIDGPSTAVPWTHSLKKNHFGLDQSCQVCKHSARAPPVGAGLNPPSATSATTTTTADRMDGGWLEKDCPVFIACSSCWC